MRIPEIQSRLMRHLSNLPGWRTNRKILVIESDDWGSIRMPSREVFDRLKVNKVNIGRADSLRYNLYDTLASPEDLNALFELLVSFRDINNNPCVFTSVCNVANPDFQKIIENDFRTYFYESFTETLIRYYHNTKSFDLWKQGIVNRIFIPQFHGREHLHVAQWMRALQQNDRDTRIAFDLGVWGFSPQSVNGLPISYQSAFELYNPEDLDLQTSVIKEGLTLFHSLFGYRATYFVPPNGPFNNSLEKIAADHGIKYVGKAKIQIEPLGNGKTRRIFHWLGQKNSNNQRYLIRNCFFEPSQPGRNWVSTCMKEIEIAFRWNKPAIISSHRVNYIGANDNLNRVKGLHSLQLLLKSITDKWPDVEFLTSDQLGDIIKEEIIND